MAVPVCRFVAATAAHIEAVVSFGDGGRPVQVDPIKPTLKAPGTKRLQL